MITKPALTISAIFLFILSACEKPEEILPVPENSSVEEHINPTDIADEKETPVNVDSELYQYGEFRDMPYRILFPRNYDSTKTYPLHVFLHGIGESGTDNEQQLSWGSTLFQEDSIREEYPSFIIFPQCPASRYWFDEEITQKLTGLIDALISDHTIDMKEISIGGFSMGAYGTFAMVARNPDLFASAVAISGDGDKNKAALMSKTRWRIFAGKKDHVVTSVKSEKMAKALEKAGAWVSFTLYPESDHGGTLVRAFSEPDFFHWLYSVNKERGMNKD